MSIEEAIPGNHAIDAQVLGDLMDSSGVFAAAVHQVAQHLMDSSGEYAGALAASDHLARRLLDQLRFQHEVLAEIYDLTDPASRTPLADRDICRIKAAVALKAATKSGLLS